MRSRRKTVAPKPLRARYPIGDREVRIGEWPLLRGQAVRRKPHDHPRYGKVATMRGVVEDIYRREPDGPVLVDVRGDAKLHCAGLFTVPLERLAWTKARIATDWVRD